MLRCGSETFLYENEFIQGKKIGEVWEILLGILSDFDLNFLD